MAAEIKVLFEGIGNVKKQIEDAFKGTLKLKSKESKVEKDSIDSLKGQIKEMTKLRNSITNLDKIMELNKKINKQQQQVGKLTNAGVKGKSGGGMGVGAIAKGTFIGGALLSLVKGTKAISFILETISGLLNALIGPFVPMMLKVMTPLFKVLLSMSYFMYNFFKDPLKALMGAGDTLLGGKGEKAQLNASKNVARGAGAIAGGIIGAIFGPVGIAIGAVLGAWIADLGVTLFENVFKFAATFGEILAEFGYKLGEIIAEGVLWIYDKLKIAGDWIVDKLVTGMVYVALLGKLIYDSIKSALSTTWELLKEFSTWIWEKITGAFSSTWEILKGFADWVYTSLKDSLSDTWESMKDAGKELVNAFIDMANWVIDKYNSIPVLGDVGTIPSVNDGIISPAGKIVSVNPKDYLMASKNPDDFRSGGNSGNNITINLTVQGNTDKSVVDTIMKKLRTELSKKGAY